MSIVSKAQLKADFLDGKIITEDKMDDLIDSTYNPNLVAGTDITLVPSGNDITINSTGGGGALSIEDEGVLIDAATVLIDFVGVGVTATSTGAGSVEVNIPGGGVINTIYTADDAILAVRDVTLPALQNLTFTSPASGNAVLLVGDQIAGGGGIFALGDNAAPANGTSVTIGKDSSTGGDSSIAIGDQAQAGMGGNNTIAIGFSASTGIPNGENAIAIGNTAQVNMTSGANAIAIGSNSSADNGSSIAIGQTAQSHADNVIAIGPSTEAGAGGGDGGIAIGNSSQANQTAGDSGVAIGNGAIADETNSIAIGTGAVSMNAGNISIGETAGGSQIAGSDGQSIFIGEQAGTAVSGGTGRNIFIGNQSGASQSTGNKNIFIGVQAAENNLTGAENVYIGDQAAGDISAGNGNVGMGHRALEYLQGTSQHNVAIGTITGGGSNFQDFTAQQNTLVGYGAGFDLGDGVAVGSSIGVTAVGASAGPSTVGNSNQINQTDTVAIGNSSGWGAMEGAVANNTVDNSVYIGSYATVPTDGQNEPSRFVLGGGRDGSADDASKLLMYGGFEDVDGAAATYDARLKINPGTGIGQTGAGDTATYPEATLHVVADTSGGTTQAFRIDADPAAAQSLFEIDNTGVVTIGEAGGTPYSLPIADGNANEVLTTDGAGNTAFRPALQHLNGSAPNVGDASFAMPQVHFSGILASQTTQAGMWIVPFNVTITQIQIKWAGNTAPTIGGGENLTWDIGILTDPALTPDTTVGTVNFTSSTATPPGGDGLPTIAVTNADDGDFFYKTWTGSIDFTGGDIMIMYYSHASTSWSPTSSDVQVDVTYFQRH